MHFLFSEEAVSAQGGFGFSLFAVYLQMCKRAALWNSVALFQSASATERTWLHRKPAKYDCLVPPQIYIIPQGQPTCKAVGTSGEDRDHGTWTTFLSS